MKQLVFLGAIDHSALKQAYESRNHRDVRIKVL